MKYIGIILAFLLLAACTPDLTATQPRTTDAADETLESIPEERIPLSPTSTGEQVTAQQLAACEERDMLLEAIKKLKAEQDDLFDRARQQQSELDLSNSAYKSIKNKLESSLLGAEQRHDLSAEIKRLQAQIDEELDELRDTNKRLKIISDSLVENERDAEFLRFRCADLQ